MRKELLEILACPRCLGNLTLKNGIFDRKEIIEGKLYCRKCKLHFPIKEEVAVFGIRQKNMSERYSELDGEGKWASEVVDLRRHVDYAKKSAWVGEMAIKKICNMIQTKKGRTKRKMRVLDVGSGMGFQSWQFSKHGFESIAVELSPEFLFAGDCLITPDVFFERVVADCTLLPFKDGSFDIVFCKELVHHIGEPENLLSEVSRVASSNAIIMFREPCHSILIGKGKLRKMDKAADVGITHHYYSFNDYVALMCKTASSIHISGAPIEISSVNHPFLSNLIHIINLLHRKFVGIFVPLEKLFVKAELILMGGTVELIGVKAREYRKKMDRNVIPINVQELNNHQIDFYRKKFIPAVLVAFSDTHKKAISHAWARLCTNN